MVVPLAPVQVLVFGHLSRVSRQSRLSANNEIIPRDVYGSPSIYLIAEENPRKHQLGDHLIKVVIASNGVPCPGSTSREKEKKVGRKEFVLLLNKMYLLLTIHLSWKRSLNSEGLQHANLTEKFLPAPGFNPGSVALHSVTLPYAPSRRIAGSN